MKKILITVLIGVITSTTIMSQNYLAFRFADVKLVRGNSLWLQFDVEVEDTYVGYYFRDLQLFINYNTGAFGDSLVANNKLILERLDLLNDTTLGTFKYNTIGIRDNTASRFAFGIAALHADSNNAALASGYFTEMPTSFAKMVRILIPIEDSTALAGISFESSLMNGGQYFQHFTDSISRPETFGSYSFYDNELLTQSLQPVTIWNGGTSTAWEDASNWTGPLPDAYRSVIIPSGLSNYPELYSNAWCFDLTVETGATLHLTDGYQLTVRGYNYTTPCGEDYTDPRDGQIYSTVQIGDQCWMTKNLNYGYQIVATEEQINNGIVEKHCYDNNPARCLSYGALYQWNEVMGYVNVDGSPGICPDGWHIPTDEEWKTLEGNTDSQYGVGDPVWNGTGYRGSDAAYHLKATHTWGAGGHGDNASGFNALPGGFHFGGAFINLYYTTHFWTSTLFSNTQAWKRVLNAGNNTPQRDANSFPAGFSIRCLRD